MKNKVRHCLFFPKPRDRSRKIRSLPSVLRLFAAPPDLQRAPRTSPAALWAAISAPDGSISLPRLRSERCFAPDWSTRYPKMIQKSVSMLPKTVMARIKHASQTAIHEASGGLPNKKLQGPETRDTKPQQNPRARNYNQLCLRLLFWTEKNMNSGPGSGPILEPTGRPQKWDLLVPDNKAAPKQGTKCGPSAGTINLRKL